MLPFKQDGFADVVVVEQNLEPAPCPRVPVSSWEHPAGLHNLGKEPAFNRRKTNELQSACVHGRNGTVVYQPDLATLGPDTE